MYKLVCTDLDDSLLRSDNTISKETMEAVEDLKKAGIRLIVNTGRTRFGSSEIVKKLGLENEIRICINGAVMTYPDPDKDTLLGQFSSEDYLHLLNTARRDDRAFIVFTTEGVKYEKLTPLLDRHLKRFQLDRESEIADCDSISDSCRVNIIKYDNSESEYEYLREICPENCSITISPFEDMAHYLPGGITKAVGLKMLLDK